MNGAPLTDQDMERQFDYDPESGRYFVDRPEGREWFVHPSAALEWLKRQHGDPSPNLCPYHNVEHWPWDEIETAIVKSSYAICWALSRCDDRKMRRLLHEGRIPQDLFEEWLFRVVKERAALRSELEIVSRAHRKVYEKLREWRAKAKQLEAAAAAEATA